MPTEKRAAKAAGQLLFHRERLEWMRRKIEENELALRSFLKEYEAEVGERVPLFGGLAATLTPEGGVFVEVVAGASGFEQLSLDDAAA